jgi:hypothetical protein
MIRLSLAIAAGLALAGCTQGSVQSASTIAEKSVTSANQVYVTASKAGMALVNAGLLDKTAFKAADAKAYAVLINVRLGRATFADLATATAALTGAK